MSERIRSMQIDIDKALEMEAEIERLRARVAELEGEVAKLRECVNAADALSDHAWRLQKNERWSSDGSHRLIHSDGMLNLEGYDREYRAARAEVENG